MGSIVFRILQTLINPSGFAFISVFSILNPVDPLASVSNLYYYNIYTKLKGYGNLNLEKFGEDAMSTKSDILTATCQPILS